MRPRRYKGEVSYIPIADWVNLHRETFSRGGNLTRRQTDCHGSSQVDLRKLRELDRAVRLRRPLDPGLHRRYPRSRREALSMFVSMVERYDFLVC